jgi:hypothetical protein
VIWFLSNELCFLPEPWRGIENTTSWIKIIPHHKTWEILFITYLPPHTCFIDFILWKAWRRNTQCDNKKFITWVSTHWIQNFRKLSVLPAKRIENQNVR